MKSDIDALMSEHGIDALLVTGAGDHNPAMVYLTGGAFLTQADLIKKRGADPVLFYYAMERDEAEKTGLPARCLDDFPIHKLLAEAGGDEVEAMARRYQCMLADLNITSGRVAIFGNRDAGEAYAIFHRIQALMPDLELTGGPGHSILSQAMATKDADEVERIRRMGRITVEVVAQTADFLASHKTKDETLVKADGSPLTIGDVKRWIHLWLAERGVEDPEGTIFSIGRDAGVPHNSGSPASPLRLGQTIVYDIFPCEAGGGYFYDFTRTWCLGYATDEALALYQDVRDVYRQITSELQVGTPTREYQQRACALFEARGYPTACSDPLTQSGYVHGLGHGVGLYVHDSPSFSLYTNEQNLLAPGSVVTIEPGLYYPERGLGVRIEDTLWMRPDGQAEVLAEYPYDLVLSMK